MNVELFKFIRIYVSKSLQRKVIKEFIIIRAIKELIIVLEQIRNKFLIQFECLSKKSRFRNRAKEGQLLFDFVIYNIGICTRKID